MFFFSFLALSQFAASIAYKPISRMEEKSYIVRKPVIVIPSPHIKPPSSSSNVSTFLFLGNRGSTIKTGERVSGALSTRSERKAKYGSNADLGRRRIVKGVYLNEYHGGSGTSTRKRMGTGYGSNSSPGEWPGKPSYTATVQGKGYAGGFSVRPYFEANANPTHRYLIIPRTSSDNAVVIKPYKPHVARLPVQYEKFI